MGGKNEVKVAWKRKQRAYKSKNYRREIYLSIKSANIARINTLNLLEREILDSGHLIDSERNRQLSAINRERYSLLKEIKAAEDRHKNSVKAFTNASDNYTQTSRKPKADKFTRVESSGNRIKCLDDPWWLNQTTDEIDNDVELLRSP